MCAPGPPAEFPDLQHLLPVKQLPTHRKREKGITKGFMWSISTHKLQSVAAACAVAARASTAITGASSVVALRESSKIPGPEGQRASARRECQIVETRAQ